MANKMIEEATNNLINNARGMNSSLNDLSKKVNDSMDSFFPKMAASMQRHQQYEDTLRSRIDAKFSDLDYRMANSPVKDKLELYLRFFTNVCYNTDPLKDEIIRREGEEFFNNFDKYFQEYRKYYSSFSERNYGLDDDLNIMEKLDILKKRSEEEDKRKQQLQEMFEQEQKEKNRKIMYDRVKKDILKELSTCAGLILYHGLHCDKYENDEVMAIINSIDKKQELDAKIKALQIKIDKTPSMIKKHFPKSFALKEKELNALKTNSRDLVLQKAQERVGDSYKNIRALLSSTDYDFCENIRRDVIQYRINELKRIFDINRKRIPLSIRKDDSFSSIKSWYSTDSDYFERIYLNNTLIDNIRYYEYVDIVCSNMLVKFEQSQSAKNNSNISL